MCILTFNTPNYKYKTTHHFSSSFTITTVKLQVKSFCQFSTPCWSKLVKTPRETLFSMNSLLRSSSTHFDRDCVKRLAKGIRNYSLNQVTLISVFYPQLPMAFCFYNPHFSYQDREAGMEIMKVETNELSSLGLIEYLLFLIGFLENTSKPSLSYPKFIIRTKHRSIMLG